MGIMSNICFEEQHNRNKKNGQTRLLNEFQNNNKFIIESSKSPKKRINIYIKKSYKKNNSHFIKDKNEISKDNDINKNGIDNKSRNYKILKKVKRNNSTDITERRLFNYKKGELKGKDRLSELYSGLCMLNGDVITIKEYNNISIDKKKLILKNKEKLFALNHPNIIKATSIFEGDNGDLCIVYNCEILKNVEQIIKEFGILEEKIIQIYCKQLLEALQYLHKKKIYHKNLKLNNILIDIDGSVKISDCLIYSLIFGNEKEIYNDLLISNEIENYIPPFFIEYIQYFNNEENKNNKNEFEDWQSYDLWFLGCILIEVGTGRKPWSNFNFKNNYEFFKFLQNSNLTPKIPNKLSIECQELIKILLNPSLTNKKNIYDIIFNLNFFKVNNFTYQNNNAKIEIRIKSNNNQNNILPKEDSNFNFNNNISNTISLDNGKQLGVFLEHNKVINLLNSKKNPSFTVSDICEDNTPESFLSNNLLSSIKSNQIKDSTNKNK